MEMQPPFVLLEDRLTPGAAARLYREPVEILRCDRPHEVEAALAAVQCALSRGLHAAGTFAYELGHVLETRLTTHLPSGSATPLIEVGLFEDFRDVEPAELDAFFAHLAPAPPIERLRPGRDRVGHVAMIRRVLAAIAAGEVYQANLTFPMHFDYVGDPLRLYGALRARQPTAHAALVALGPEWTLSASPELFIRVQDGEATSRPMKGTVARGADPVADHAAAAALRSDPKQWAENVMIVDLMRNDLSRVAMVGSVRVLHLLSVETYPDLHTLTSTVTARLRPDVDLRELLGALFPCGSIVGAPKIAAAELLSRLEGAERGVYTGAVGAMAPDGGLELNVAIRTLRLLPDGSGSYGVGGGIVADSDPDAEYDEALLKARLLYDLARDYRLIETLRWSRAGGLVRGAEHLDRMEASARTLSFRFDRAAAEVELATRAAVWACSPAVRKRVRLQLWRTGELEVEEADLACPSPAPLRLGIAEVRLDAGSPFTRHKTTRRDAYDAALAEAERAGWDEAVLLNRSGQVADAAQRTIFARLGEWLVTPALTSGALPGVLRAELLREGRVAEAELREADLRRASALYVGNSLRGLQPAILQEAHRLAQRPPSECQDDRLKVALHSVGQACKGA